MAVPSRRRLCPRGFYPRAEAPFRGASKRYSNAPLLDEGKEGDRRGGLTDKKQYCALLRYRRRGGQRRHIWRGGEDSCFVSTALFPAHRQGILENVEWASQRRQYSYLQDWCGLRTPLQTGTAGFLPSTQPRLKFPRNHTQCRLIL
jgi:hypothetical protein